MSQELVNKSVKPRSLVPSGEEFKVIMNICKEVHESGMLPSGIKSPQQALAIALFGRELGIPPWVAWRGIYPTYSKKNPGVQLGMSADLMLGVAKGRIPGFNHGHKIDYDEKGNLLGATFWSERPGVDRLTTIYTLKQAAKAELTTKDNWVQNPELMCIAAAKRINVRTMAADVLAGCYTPEELGGDDPPPTETARFAEPSNIMEEPIDISGAEEIKDAEIVGESNDEYAHNG